MVHWKHVFVYIFASSLFYHASPFDLKWFDITAKGRSNLVTRLLLQILTTTKK